RFERLAFYAWMMIIVGSTATATYHSNGALLGLNDARASPSISSDRSRNTGKTGGTSVVDQVSQDLQQRILQVLESIREPSGGNLLSAEVVGQVYADAGTLIVVCRNPQWPDPIRRRIENEIRSA